MSALWRRMHTETRDWAIAANDRWVASLSADDGSHPQRSPEATVVLFGPTQVGKTTLLLTLLGVAEGDSFKAVQKVLRGGRGHGQSSTATPTCYARSPDNQWRINRADAPGLSDEQMTAELAAVRRQVEAGDWRSSDPVAVFVPARHFADAEPPVRVAVLDLPGTAAADQRERELVEQVARHHVPAASLVLLVSTGSRLGVFDPAKMGQELDELRGWMRSPLRYRLVITYAFTQDSVKRWREDPGDQGCGLDALRAFYMGEMAYFELTMPADLPRRIYPLELGDSWAGLAGTEPDIHGWADAVQTQARAELIADIARSCEGERRLRISQEVRELTYCRQEELRRGWAATRRKWRKARDDHRRARDKAETERQRRAEKVASFDKALSRLDAAEAKLDRLVRAQVRRTRIAWRPVPQPVGAAQAELLDGDGAPIEATVNALRAWLLADRSKLAQTCHGITDWFNEATGLRGDAFEPSDGEASVAAHKLLDSYSMDNYWTWISGQFQLDCAAAAAATEAQRDAVTTDLSKTLLQRLWAARDALALRRRHAADQHLLCENSLSKIDFDAGRIRAKIWEMVAEHRRARAANRHNLDRMATFEADMAEAHVEERRRVTARVREAAQAGSAHLALARLCQLRLTHNVHHQYCKNVA